MLPIEKSAVKIVVFNNFKAMGVEFTNTGNNFCMEVIHLYGSNTLWGILIMYL